MTQHSDTAQWHSTQGKCDVKAGKDSHSFVLSNIQILDKIRTTYCSSPSQIICTWYNHLDSSFILRDRAAKMEQDIAQHSSLFSPRAAKMEQDIAQHSPSFSPRAAKTSRASNSRFAPSSWCTSSCLHFLFGRPTFLLAVGMHSLTKLGMCVSLTINKCWVHLLL